MQEATFLARCKNDEEKPGPQETRPTQNCNQLATSPRSREGPSVVLDRGTKDRAVQIVCASPYDRRRPQVRGFVEDCAAPVDLYLEQFFFLVELDSALYKSAAAEPSRLSLSRSSRSSRCGDEWRPAWGRSRQRADVLAERLAVTFSSRFQTIICDLTHGE